MERLMHTITIWLVSKKTLLTGKSLYSTQEGVGRRSYRHNNRTHLLIPVSHWQPAKRRKLETPVQGDMEEDSADHHKNQKEEKKGHRVVKTPR